MDSYYVELARVALGKASENIKNAQQYMARAKASKGNPSQLAMSEDLRQYELEKITRIISSVRKMDDRLGKYLTDNRAWDQGQK